MGHSSRTLRVGNSREKLRGRKDWSRRSNIVVTEVPEGENSMNECQAIIKEKTFQSGRIHCLYGESLPKTRQYNEKESYPDGFPWPE